MYLKAKWLCLAFLFTLILLSGFPLSVHAKAIYVVTSDSSAITKKITADLQKKIPSAQVISASSIPPESKDSIYIVIGPAALRAAVTQSNMDGVILSAFTSSHAYQSALEKIPASRKRMVTAIYADPSPLHQFRLINLLYKKPIKVAVVLRDNTSYLEKIIRNAAQQTRTNLIIEELIEAKNINDVLNDIGKVQVILATPNNEVFSQDNIRNILLTSYRRNQVVIGFSPAFVKAGALATTYSDIDDINTQLAELTNSFINSVQIPEPQFPKYFKTIVNENVAHSMDMIVGKEVVQFSNRPLGEH